MTVIGALDMTASAVVASTATPKGVAKPREADAEDTLVLVPYDTL